MKNIYKLLVLAMIVSFTACNEDTIEDLTGKYPPPTDYALTNLFAQQTQKLECKRIFTLKIATGGITATFNEQTFSYVYTGTGSYISIDFVGRNYFLEPGAYNVAPESTARTGNYIEGYDTEMFGMQFTNWGTCFFDVNSGTETGVKVTDGTLNVAKNGENYSILGTLALDNGEFIHVNYSGIIIYEEDPPVMTYSVEVTAPYMWTPDGMTFNPVEGSQLNKVTVKSDGTAVAYFEIVTEENPASYSGTYPVKAVNSLERAICQGQYLDLAWFGMSGIPPIESGSYLIDESKLFIRNGNVTITDNNGVLSFAISDLGIQDIATQGQFGTLPAPVSIDYKDATRDGGASGGGTHTNLFAASALDLSMFGLSGFTVTLKVATPNLTINTEAGPMGITYTYAGSGQYISFDFSRDAGTLPAGVYNVVDHNAAQVNDCLDGYPSLFGSGFMGTFVGNVVDGVVTEEVVTGGIVTVTESGFSFNLITANGTVEGSYVGAIVLQ
jgi:hypothetical protein